MKKLISILVFSLCAFAAASAAEVLMRVEPIGFRVGAEGVFEEFSESAVMVDPDGLSIATSNEPVRLTAVLNRDYRIIGWQKFPEDPRRRTGIPVTSFGAGQETVSFVPEAGVDWLYVAVVAEYDPKRTVKAGVSSFGKGSVTISPTNEVFKPGDVVTLTANPAEGHSFVRWSDGNADHNRKLTVGATDIDLKAFIEPDSCRVSFSAGEGAVLGETEKRVSYGCAYGELPVPVREDLAFAEWQDPDGRTVTAKTVVDRATDHVLTALWETKPELYTVVFDANGGTGVETRVVQTFEVGVAQKLRLNAFYYPGHVFVGWNQSSTAEERQFSDEQIVSDLAPAGATVTLFAVWRAEQVAYTVHFDKNAEDATGTMADQEFAGGEEKPLSACNFRRAGYTFLGWSTDKDAIDATYADRAKVQGLTSEKNLTLYAVWTKNPVYYISYKAMPRDKEAWKSETVEQERDYKLSDTNGLDRTGYVFAGWSNNVAKALYPAGRTCAPQDLKKMVEDEDAITFVADWKPIAYVIHFDGNGGTCTVPDQDMTYDAPKGVVIHIPNGTPQTTRENYTLLGWSTDPDGEGGILDVTTKDGYIYLQINTNLTATAEDVVTLYAIWKGEPQTVKINGQDVPIEYGSQLQKPEDPAPKAGCAFTGNWTSNGVSVTFPITVTGGFRLDPVWATNHYRVAFHGTDADGGAMGEPQTFAYDTPQALAANAFTRTGYGFAGWAVCADADRMVAYADRQVVKNLATNEGAVVDLYATWTANAYTVRFDRGEGSGEMADQAFAYDTPQALAANGFDSPERKVFGCWTNALNATTYTNGETVCNLTTGGVFVLFATWTDAPSYAVRFNPNGGEGDAYAQWIECGKPTALVTNRFARTGYGFKGWGDGGDTVAFTNGAVVTDLAAENGTNDLYAVWTPNRYWVKFDGNGADGGKAMSPQAFVYDEAQMLVSNTFEKTGHGFAGWKTNATGSVIYSDGESVSNLTARADATNVLYAAWTVKSYEITFDSNGGSAVAPVTNAYGTAVAQPGAPTREGYDFVAWYEGDEPFNFSFMPARDVRLTAHWSAPNTYRVRFNGNGGTNANGNATYEQSFTYDTGAALMDNAFIRTGHAFANWTNEAGTAYQNGQTVTNLATSGVFNLYAVWTVNRYNCKFDDGTSFPSVPYGGSVERSDPDPKTGYAFKGWTLNGTDPVDLKTFTMPDHDVFFKSLWAPITYTIAFNGNGAEGGMTPLADVKYDEEVTLPANGFTYSDREFLGWALTADAGKEKYVDGATVSNLTASAGATVTLYAVWHKEGNPLSIALGLPEDWETTSVGDAWTVIGDSKEKRGLNRTSADGAAYLEIDVPSAGDLYITFDYGGASEAKLTVTLDDEEVKDDTGNPAKYMAGAQPTLYLEHGGRLRFSGGPDNGATWTLKNFQWTAE